MKKYLLLVFAICMAFGNVQAQEIVSSTYLTSYDQQYFTDNFGITPFTGSDLYRVNYTTKNLEGALDTASGLVCIPQIEDLRVPIVSYSHGTVGSRYDVPSYESTESVISAIYSSTGAVVVAADYLGLGDNEGIHPYIHADSEAWVSLDLIWAVQEWLPNNSTLDVNEQLFITGYSQGGHAAMALHRMIEQETFMSVTGSLPMSGPYSISTGMRDLLLSEEEYSVVAYMAAVAISFQEVYGNIYPNGDIYEFFKPEYADIILSYRNEEIDLWTCDAFLRDLLVAIEGAAVPSKMLQPEVLQAIIDDENHPVNVALRDNDVYDWAPLADTRLIYCEGDDQVAYENTLIARDTMIANGASQVVAINLNPAFNHTECVQPAVTLMFFYLSQFVVVSDTDDETLDNSVTIFPNPTQGELVISFENDHQNVAVDIFNVEGRKMQSFVNVGNNEKLVLDLPKGLFIARVSNGEGQLLSVQRLMVTD